MLTLVVSSGKFPKAEEFAGAVVEKFPAVKTVLLNINSEQTNVILGGKYRLLCGKGYIEDIICGLRFRVSAPSFWQVNRDMAERMYERVRALASLQKGDKVCDLFCGTGSIGLSVIKDVKDASLVGVEVIFEAVENAAENAKINGIENARFVCGDANSADPQNSDVIIIDPPRKGCAAELVERVANISPRAVIYVSCNPDTLARDCAAFAKYGYITDTVYPFDLFPRTGHVECVVEMKRKEY